MTLFLGHLSQNAKAMRSVIFFMSRRPRGSAKPVRVLQGEFASRGLTTMVFPYVFFEYTSFLSNIDLTNGQI